ncbi:MAG: FtsW/RodA/SpoVE family cell cycle protein, partial [Planctomycetota bacterium]|nr:FtsW/RodA/SpoVE family cell cycle protein [Planctomycetota bacterium]
MVKYLRKIDWATLIPALMLSGIGLLFIASAAENMGSPPPPFAERQILWLFVSILVYFTLLFLGLKRIKKMAPFFFAAAFLLVALVLEIGTYYKGAKRWITLGWFNLQPSEFAKFSYILFIPLLLIEGKAKKITYFAIFLGITLLLILLIAAEPDLGTSLVFLPLGFIMASAAGTKRLYLASAFLILIIATLCSLEHLRPYQKERILAFANPEPVSYTHL